MLMAAMRQDKKSYMVVNSAAFGTAGQSMPDATYAVQYTSSYIEVSDIARHVPRLHSAHQGSLACSDPKPKLR